MIKKFAAQKNNLTKIEQDEFRSLVAEVAAQGFTNSGQVSKYIVHNKLGDRYQNISGFLEMKKAGDIWDFKGGFPTRIFALLCQELNLDNNGSMARPGKFRAFKDSN